VQTHFIRIDQASVAVTGAEACSFLHALTNGATPTDKVLRPDIELSKHANGLHLTWNRGVDRPLKYHLDFFKIASQLRSFPAPKQGAFNQALGKKTRHVIDATGGWGGDALLMCIQGYHVTIFERHLLMACLLGEAFQRLEDSDWAQYNEVSVPKVVCADAISALDPKRFPADCVYLDPMFPPKKKKFAATNKYMQLLRWLIRHDADSAQLAAAAIKAAYPRLAVKRPDYAEPLIEKPATQFSSKLIHYDVYLNG